MVWLFFADSRGGNGRVTEGGTFQINFFFMLWVFYYLFVCVSVFMC